MTPDTSLRAVVLDLDGTLYRGSTPIPGASEVVARLRRAGFSIHFFSNNPSRTPGAYVERLASMGVSATESEVLTAGTLTASYLADDHAGERCYVVGTDDLRAQLRRAGVAVTTDPAEVDVLVGSWTDDFDYGTMTTVLRAAESDTPFVGTDPDRTFPSDDGPLPGSGAIVAALAGVLDRDPDLVVGKPSDYAVAAVLDAVDASPGDCLVVGDRLSTDVRLGERAGTTTALVLSGVTDRADVEASSIRPDYVLDSVADLDRVAGLDRVFDE
ncbi:MAG: HAD-IIA family hydrolase [Haloarculaceae archaeon]